jgi:hypothetical protein
MQARSFENKLLEDNEQSEDPAGVLEINIYTNLKL